MVKKALIVVDYQKDFVSGSLGFPEAVKLDEKISAKIEAALCSEESVIFTLDTHYENYLGTQEGAKLANICLKRRKWWKKTSLGV